MPLKNFQFALWGLVAIAAGAFGGYFYVNGVSAPTNVVRSVGVPAIGGDFDLIDHNGGQITQAALEGQPSVLFFGFTHCPEICPTTLHDVAGWLDSAGDAGKDIKAFFITVDPERDNPEIMKDYVTAFSDRITGITGSPEKVDQILKNYRVFSRKVRLGDGDYTMDHSATVILLDKNAEFVSTISFGEETDVAIRKLKNLATRG